VQKAQQARVKAQEKARIEQQDHPALQSEGRLERLLGQGSRIAQEFQTQASQVKQDASRTTDRSQAQASKALS
jgi:hypothetical protein